MAKSLVYWFLALIALAVLAVFCVRAHVPQIATDLETRSRLALNDADLVDVTIERVDGLNVVLGGTVADEASQQRALDAVSRVPGVFTAVNEMVLPSSPPAAAPGPVQFSATADREAVVLSGRVSDAAMRASVVGAARLAFAQRRVIDELGELSATPAAWTALLRDLLPVLATFSSGKLDLRDGHISLVGTVASADLKTAARDVLERSAGEAFSHRLDVAILAPAQETVANCQASVDARLSNATVQFTSGSATLSVDSYPLLEELADIVAGCAGVLVELQGHTDAAGDAAANLSLSQRRADAVKQYLIDEGIDASRLTAVGIGETQPRADNSTPAGRAQNRRIEFVMTGN